MPIGVELLRANSGVADGTSIYLVENKYILHLSPPLFPQVALEEANAMEHARARLQPKADDVILPVVAKGSIDGRSFIVIPLCKPISSGRITGSIQRLAVRPKVLEWLRQLAEMSSEPDQAALSSYQSGLEKVCAAESIKGRLREAAEFGLARINSGFVPRFTPMHGDLWRGNIMLFRDKRFAVIDWRGSRMQGFGIYDLIRFAECYKIPNKLLGQEITAHRNILGGQSDIILAGALAHIFSHLGEFPVERFLAMAEACFRAHDRALNA